MFSKIKNATQTLAYRTCYTLPPEVIPNLSWERFQTLPHRKRMNLYLSSAKHIEEIRHIIPCKYTELKKRALADNLYLVDARIASDIAKHILPFLNDKSRKVCETNAGLGFLTSELLEGGVDQIRLYETCSDFRLTLKGFSRAYPDKVELFVKDLFHIWKMSYMDKLDRGSRVAQFLKGVPKREWSDDPVMTIIGTMSKLDFLSYMFKMISLQSEIATHGRIELFVIMRPGDYLKLTAGPHCDLHTYQPISILANLFCNFTLLEKYPRIAFLPWETLPSDSKRTRTFKKYEIDKLYLVHIEFKRDLPLQPEQLVPFYFFVRQAFGRGSVLIIKKLEQWIPGIGQEILLPEKENPLLEHIDIFTKTGQLLPTEFLETFKVTYNHPRYASSPLIATVEAELLKLETIETDIADAHNKSVESNV